MTRTIQLILCGTLPLTGNGSLAIRKEPPFKVLTPGWAAIAIVDLENDVPHIRRVLDFMASYPDHDAPVIIGANGVWITGDAYCVSREAIHRGWRYTFALARYHWSTPCRLGDVRKKRRAA